ncbi:hypothetical protein YPPY08_1316, partial [Yersinia pestis PY-08]
MALNPLPLYGMAL